VKENTVLDAQLEVFSTCPQWNGSDRDIFLKSVADSARWSEQQGCKGILVYSDNSQIDPWLVSQLILQNTRDLCPLVAVQPIYMHPYSVAKTITSIAYLQNRQIYLNMVAGGFKNDLATLSDTTAHDKRYERLLEYTLIIKQLLDGRAPVTYQGKFYRADGLSLTPRLPPELFPGIFVSGSSEAGAAAARELAATTIEYPKPSREYTKRSGCGQKSGIRVGLIARETEYEAWRIAFERFPCDRKGELTHQIAMKTSDSVWHKNLSELEKQTQDARNPYWLRPFETYKSFCPYLVGSHECVAEEISKYLMLGYTTFITDIPQSEEDLHHISIAFNRATRQRGFQEASCAAS
jgi:alkanesulfonate monooxygenase